MEPDIESRRDGSMLAGEFIPRFMGRILPVAYATDDRDHTLQTVG